MIADGIARDRLDARVDGVASIFQVFPGSSLEAPDGLSPQAAMFIGLLVDGFHLAPRGMGALATPTTESDVDELADAILVRIGAMQVVPAA
jgi:hypothetical protein